MALGAYLDVLQKPRVPCLRKLLEHRGAELVLLKHKLRPGRGADRRAQTSKHRWQAGTPSKRVMTLAGWALLPCPLTLWFPGS